MQHEIRAESNWSNDEWGATWLPWVRMAAVLLHQDDCKLRGCPDQAELVGHLMRTKKQLESMRDLIDSALGRLFQINGPPPRDTRN